MEKLQGITEMLSNKTEIGFVSFVSGGPGPVDLLTLRGLRSLQAADVILYDALLDPGFLDLFPEACTALYVGKRASEHSRTQNEISELLVSYALAGKKVVRLKGGDASIFGRLAEEIEVLKQNQIPFEVIPGVSSVSAGAATLKTSLTLRGKIRQIIILDGHTILEDERSWMGMENFQGTIAILMGSKQVHSLAQKLIQKGIHHLTPILLCENVGGEKSTHFAKTLEDAAKSGIPKSTKGPGILYVGEVFRPILETFQMEGNTSISKNEF